MPAGLSQRARARTCLFFTEDRRFESTALGKVQERTDFFGFFGLLYLRPFMQILAAFSPLQEILFLCVSLLSRVFFLLNQGVFLAKARRAATLY